MSRVILLLFTVICISSCDPGVQGNGNVSTETRELESFHSIDLSGAYEVYLTQSTNSGLKIETDENLHQYIETYVDDGILYVSSTRRIGRHRELALYMNFKDLKSIDASGASEVKTRGAVRGEKLSMDFSGAVEADLELDYEQVIGDFSGASELNLKGKASLVSLDGSGAIEVNALNLITKKFVLDVSGAAEASVHVTEELVIDASGAVEVNYKGNPKSITKDVSGAASIEAI